MGRITSLKLNQDQETLDLNIDKDPLSGLPYYKEKDKILRLILAYLPLPYNVAEYGCGKKCNIILYRLISFGIPAYALKRGMIIENDMSPEALNTADFHQRKHALIIENPLFHMADLEDESLKNMLKDEGISIRAANSEIHTENFILSHQKLLQFRNARSHIFTILTCWDSEREKAVELAIDPTIHADDLFKVPQIRNLLNSREALIFTAPMLGHFQLDEKYLTSKQKWHLHKLTDSKVFRTLPPERMDEIIREFISAEENSIGDPSRWSYANNYQSGAQYIFENQRKHTGRGDIIRPLFDQLIRARTEQSEDALQIRDQLIKIGNDLGLQVIMKDDARWSEESLEQLADIDHTISYHEALSRFSEMLANEELYDMLNEELEQLTGIARKLQDRIITLGILSKNEEGEIDARALNDHFIRAAIETIRQMNRAGLSVFIDKVGNIHGILMDTATKLAYSEGKISLKEITKTSVCHCSHIDTVKDAGIYDGRLGVLSGIQVADMIHNLHHFFGIPLLDNPENLLMVSAYIGEEMTFTGENVSMPGSAAVTGNAQPEAIYRMQNVEGELFREKLIQFLSVLKDWQTHGQLKLMNNFRQAFRSEHLLSACFDCEDFFSTHTYERHIEQGPLLDRRGIPLALVKTIMGIYQEDFRIQGEKAEAAALDLNLRFRSLSLGDNMDQLRTTVGVLQEISDSKKTINHDFAIRCTITGAKNHAGATLVEDRRDPGVAGARLVQEFRKLVDTINREYVTAYQGEVTGVRMIPGTNRNVIPESLALTLSLNGGSPDEKIQNHLIRSLQDFAFGTLSKNVSEGGEGILAFDMDFIKFSSRAENLRMSLDIRGADQKVVDDCIVKIGTWIKAVEKRFEVHVGRSTEQEMAPFSLDQSGQVLQIERSYGGSHNPDEAQLINDLLRGTLLQFAVSNDLMKHRIDGTFNLYQFVHDHLPDEWQEKNGFISGALHDTCNIAARVQKNP